MDILYTLFPQFLSLTLQAKTRVMKPLSLSIIGYKCWSYPIFGSRILQLPPFFNFNHLMGWTHGVKPPHHSPWPTPNIRGSFLAMPRAWPLLASSSLTMMRKTPWQMLHVVSSLSHSWSLEEIVPSKFYVYYMSYPQIHILVKVGGFKYFQTTSFAKEANKRGCLCLLFHQSRHINTLTLTPRHCSTNNTTWHHW